MTVPHRLVLSALLTVPALTACAPALNVAANRPNVAALQAAASATPAPGTPTGSAVTPSAAPQSSAAPAPVLAVPTVTPAPSALRAAAPGAWTAGLSGLGYNSTLDVIAVSSVTPDVVAALRTYPSADPPTQWIRVAFDNTKADPDQDLKKAYALTNFTAPLNFSGVTTISFMVFNPTAITLDAALSVTTTVTKEWQESKLMPVRPGWSQVTFTLTEPTFKAERSGWANTVTVRDLNDVRGLALMIYPHQGIKNFVLVAPPTTNAAVAE